jgi:TonB family protein
MKTIVLAFFVVITFSPQLFSQQKEAKPKLQSFGVKPVDFDDAQYSVDAPAKLKQPLEVTYPDSAMKRKLEGIVIISAAIDRDANVTYAEISTGSGYRLLDSAALAAVKDAYFIAARQGNKRVASRMTIPVEFRLDQGGDSWNVDKTTEQLREDKADLERQKKMIEDEKKKVEEELRRLKEAQKKK